MNNTPDTKRIESIDLLRGLIMIIMALDHVRDFTNYDSFHIGIENLNQTYGFLFFTRWITHLCAPLFMFLSGISAFLYGRTRTKKELSLFLLKRGIWLIFLELTVINFAWLANPKFGFFGLLVIWALGISMICLAALVWLPRKYILIFGLVLIAGHNILDGIKMDGNSLGVFLWSICHQGFKGFEFHGISILVIYPVIPWIGVMGVGYALGEIFTSKYSKEYRTRFLTTAGLSCIALFLILRMTNFYGDPLPWSRQRSASFSFMSFIKVNKYPPSLDYLLVMVGIGLLFLAFTEKPLGRLGRIISTFGRVPFFYYVIHLYAIHLIAIFIAVLQGIKWTDMVSLQGLPTGSEVLQSQGYGLSLGGTYIVWILLIIALYPFCKWYDGYKSRHKEKWWLSYL
jgi:uncharacterized membrane protein